MSVGNFLGIGVLQLAIFHAGELEPAILRCNGRAARKLALSANLYRGSLFMTITICIGHVQRASLAIQVDCHGTGVRVAFSPASLLLTATIHIGFIGLNRRIRQCDIILDGHCYGRIPGCGNGIAIRVCGCEDNGIVTGINRRFVLVGKCVAVLTVFSPGHCQRAKICRHSRCLAALRKGYFDSLFIIDFHSESVVCRFPIRSIVQRKAALDIHVRGDRLRTFKAFAKVHVADHGTIVLDGDIDGRGY